MEHVNERTSTPAASRSLYVGPSAARIAELVAPRQRVRFELGWFWTAAFCHGTEHGQEQDLDQMAFRQRPDGDGIDVHCQSADCSRERIIRSLEQLTNESIWSAYAAETRASASALAQPLSDSPALADRSGARSLRPALLTFMTVMVVLLPAPFILGAEFQFAALSAVGYGWVGWLAHQALVSGRRAAAATKGGRTR